VGKPEDFPPDSAIFIPERKIFISRAPQGFRAISAVCTHLRCTINPFVDPDDRYPVRHSLCPCHGSVFDIDGNVLDGPAPRPLEFFAMRLAPDGRLQVDAARRVPPAWYFRA
jgi:Rieske Fe-S protein